MVTRGGTRAAQSLSGLYILNIYTEYLTVIIFNIEIIQKILTIYVSHLLIECICCVRGSSWCDCLTFSSYLNGRQYWHWIHRIIKPLFHITKPLFSLSKLLNVYQLNQYQIGCFMFKCLNQSFSLPSLFLQYFSYNKDVHHYNTRHAAKIHIKKVRNTTRKLTLKHSGSILWNSLNNCITQSHSLSSFQIKLRNFLMEANS
jgi:hypothetical protein